MDESTAMLLICLLVALWLFAFGACVGSFLNVVIYRVPAGLSIVYPPSACPRCGSGIRSLDNIPLLSWLMLGGNCRACCCPISFRYPGVEFLVACGAAVIGCVQIFGVGRNLPSPTPLAPARISPIDEQAIILWGIAAFHFLLWVTLVAAAFIEYDGESPPWNLFAPATVVGILAPIFWPQLRPLPYQATCPALGITSLNTSAEWVRCVWGDMLFGLAAGAAMGTALSFLVASFTPQGRWPTIAAATLVGLFLGWQAAIALAIGATIAWPMLHFVASRCGGAIPWTGALAAALIPFLLAWKTLASWCG